MGRRERETYWAKKAACDLAAMATFGKLFDDLAKDEVASLRQCWLARTGSDLHLPSGFMATRILSRVTALIKARPTTRISTAGRYFQGDLPGREKAPDRKFYLLIDEINRGDFLEFLVNS